MTTQERSVFWQEQLSSWLASGLSGPAFCKHYALSYHQFSYWRRKLQQPLPAPADSLAGFAKVAMPAPVITEGSLTLTLPCGVVISGLHAANISLLGAIMRQL